MKIIGNKMNKGSSSKLLRNSSCNYYNNAQFMQPLLHSFLNAFSIPVSFQERMEMEINVKAESVVLTTEDQPGCHWTVKLEGGRHFKDGWKEFCDHHGLKVGDFVVFTHQLNYIFQVCVFDPSTACQRYLSSYSSLKPPGSKRTKVGLKPSSSDHINGKRKAQEQATSTVKAQKLSCQITLTSFAFRKSLLYIPKDFIRACGLLNKKCYINLIDEEGKSWTVQLTYRKNDGQSYFNTGGWKPFQAANDLRPRDIICFQLLKKRGRRPTFKCHRK